METNETQILLYIIGSYLLAGILTITPIILLIIFLKKTIFDNRDEIVDWTAKSAKKFKDEWNKE